METYVSMLNAKNTCQAIKEKYFDKIMKYTEGRYKKLSIQVINEILDDALNKKLKPYSLEDYLDQALDFLFDLKSALDLKGSTWNKNEKLESFYQDNSDYKLEPWKYSENNICISSINELISKYISYEWCSPSLEWYMINGCLAYVVHRNRNDYIYQWLNIKTIASLFSNKTHSNKTYYDVSYFLLKFLECWIFLIKIPSSIFKSFATSDYVTSFSGIAALIIYAGYYYYKLKQRKQLMALLNLKMYASSQLFSPSILWEKAKNVSKFFFMPELLSLISKIVKRNPDIFNITQY